MTSALSSSTPSVSSTPPQPIATTAIPPVKTLNNIHASIVVRIPGLQLLCAGIIPAQTDGARAEAPSSEYDLLRRPLVELALHAAERGRPIVPHVEAEILGEHAADIARHHQRRDRAER